MIVQIIFSDPLGSLDSLGVHSILAYMPVYQIIRHCHCYSDL